MTLPELVPTSRLVLVDSWWGFTVPHTGNAVFILEQRGWKFFTFGLTNSGVMPVVWDLRPNRPVCESSGRVEHEQEFEAIGIQEAFRRGRELHALLLDNMVPIFSREPTQVRDALNRGTILHTSDAKPLQWYTDANTVVRKPRLTQKLLDGGSDMTLEAVEQRLPLVTK